MDPKDPKYKTMKETNPKAPGYKTTEFWLTFLLVAVTAIVDADLFSKNDTVTKILITVVTTLKALGYTTSRAALKRSMLPLFLVGIGFLNGCATTGPSGKTLGECRDASILTEDWKDRIGADVGKLVAFGLDGIATENWRGFAGNALTHLAASYGPKGGDLVSCFLGLPRLSDLPIFGNIGGAAGDTDPRVEKRLEVLQSLAPPASGAGMD